jgi:hypothetical protein
MAHDSWPTRTNALAMIQLHRRGRFHLFRVHLSVLGAQRCPGQFEPSARGMNSVAAIATGALDLAESTLFTSVGIAAGANGQLKSAMWQRPRSFQYRPHGLLELGSGCGRGQLPTKPIPLATRRNALPWRESQLHRPTNSRKGRIPIDHSRE